MSERAAPARAEPRTPPSCVENISAARRCDADGDDARWQMPACRDSTADSSVQIVRMSKQTAPPRRVRQTCSSQRPA